MSTRAADTAYGGQGPNYLAWFFWGVVITGAVIMLGIAFAGGSSGVAFDDLPTAQEIAEEIMGDLRDKEEEAHNAVQDGDPEEAAENIEDALDLLQAYRKTRDEAVVLGADDDAWQEEWGDASGFLTEKLLEDIMALEGVDAELFAERSPEWLRRVLE